MDLNNVWEYLLHKLKQLLLIDFFENLWGKLAALIKTVWEYPGVLAKQLLVLLENFWGSLVSLINIIWEYPWEKFKQLLVLMDNLCGSLVAWISIMWEYPWEKFKQSLVLMENFWGNLGAWIQNVFKQLLVLVENFWGNSGAWIINVFKQLLVLMEDLWGDSVAWMDQVFPPETRIEKFDHWIHLCLPYLICAVVLGLLALVIYCCVRFGLFSCCLEAGVAGFRMIFSCCLGAGKAGVAGVKMMKAPGAAGIRIVRAGFEIAPRAYFIALRAGEIAGSIAGSGVRAASRPLV